MRHTITKNIGRNLSAYCLVAALLALSAGPVAILDAAMERHLSEQPFAPAVALTVAPPAGTSAYTVEDSIQGEALPTGISHGGVFDRAASKVKWGPFIDNQPRELSYRLSGPEGTVDLSAKASYDGSSEEAVTGSVALPDPSSNFFGTLFLRWAERDFIRFSSDPSEDERGRFLFGEYAFGRGVFGPLAPGEALEFLMPADPGGNATVRALVKAAAQDVEFGLEVAEDLGSWQSFEVRYPASLEQRRELSGIPGIEEIRFEDIPLASEARMFFRLRASWISDETVP